MPQDSVGGVGCWFIWNNIPSVFCEGPFISTLLVWLYCISIYPSTAGTVWYEPGSSSPSPHTHSQQIAATGLALWGCCVWVYSNCCVSLSDCISKYVSVSHILPFTSSYLPPDATCIIQTQAKEGTHGSDMLPPNLPGETAHLLFLGLGLPPVSYWLWHISDGWIMHLIIWHPLAPTPRWLAFPWWRGYASDLSLHGARPWSDREGFLTCVTIWLVTHWWVTATHILVLVHIVQVGTHLPFCLTNFGDLMFIISVCMCVITTSYVCMSLSL